MTLPMEVASNGKLVVVGTRGGKELNILVKPNSYKPLIILSESRYTHEREDLGTEDKMHSLKHCSHGWPDKEIGGPSCFLFPPPSISYQKTWGHVLPSCPAGPFLPQLLLWPAGWKHCCLWGESVPRARNHHMIPAGSGGAEKVCVKAWCFVQIPSHLFVSRSAERTPRAWWVPWWR